MAITTLRAYDSISTSLDADLFLSNQMTFRIFCIMSFFLYIHTLTYTTTLTSIIFHKVFRAFVFAYNSFYWSSGSLFTPLIYNDNKKQKCVVKVVKHIDIVSPRLSTSLRTKKCNKEWRYVEHWRRLVYFRYRTINIVLIKKVFVHEYRNSTYE